MSTWSYKRHAEKLYLNKWTRKYVFWCWIISGCNLHTQFKVIIIQRSSTLTKVRKEKVITQKMEILNHLRSYNFILECQFVRIWKHYIVMQNIKKKIRMCLQYYTHAPLFLWVSPLFSNPVFNSNLKSNVINCNIP